MKIYTVHSLPWSAASDGDLIIVREGFSWWALIFGPLWALWHGLWRTAIVLVAISLAIGALAGLLGMAADAATWLQLVVQIGFGLWANDLRRMGLARRGYVERAVVAGGSLQEAEQRYFITVAAEHA